MNELLSLRAQTLKPSPTLSISSTANKLKAEGVNIINLSVGEPDFNTPEAACEAAIQAIHEGKTKYTNVDGIPSLKKAVQKKFQIENNLNFELDEIFVSSGAKQGIFNAFACSLNSGDEVIIPAPYWVSYSDIVEIFDGKPIIIKTLFEENFKLKAEALEKSITPKTKWIILNSPSNPTGEVYLENELRAIADVLLKYPHIFILSDDIYEHLIFDSLPFINIVNIEPRLLERTLVINGVSKSHSMTGWRIGYGAMKNKRFIKAIVNLQSQSTSNASSISQEAALGALEKCSSFPQTARNIMQERRDLAFTLLSQIKGLKVKKPSGAFYIFFGIHDLLGKKTPSGNTLHTCEDVAAYFLTQGKVASVFGNAFGMGGFIRISYAINEEALKEAIARISAAIALLI